MNSPHSQSPERLSVRRGDPEAMFGLSPAPGTSTRTAFCGLIALIFTATFFGVISFLPASSFKSMMLDRGPTQYAAVLLGFWAAVILVFKRMKLSIQRRALEHPVIPENQRFTLTRQTAPDVLTTIHAIADFPDQFLVFRRILIALSSLKNLGRIGDVDEVLQSMADRDESASATSFGMLSGFLWAIPVLGFIGTVLGLAGAIGNFSSLLTDDSDVAGIVSSLREVTGGLSTAFETTLVALVIALLLQLWITVQKKAEEEFLDQCQDYCLSQIVSRMRADEVALNRKEPPPEMNPPSTAPTHASATTSEIKN
ncbi:MotA/TolQ/ExbB proton channel family protein [Stieleria sp. JC731]|uniref:MotA/TolQ/ExbB proton channel family protein n=1 Tax=Pirellulaceae TaxID=2691357 RepID=UPI001E364239|nr:MotA/TolQ/ExbB proton channel family protein [Stieleria sp. JC731]MCC9602653.1 MotA/TolQ/ExbB proton channel family protein [Stieleria sp. JC731]